MGFTPLFGPQRQRSYDQPKTLEQASSQPDPAAAKAPQRSGAEAPLHNERNVALLSHARGAASLNSSLKAFHRDASLVAALPKRACMQTLAQEPLYRCGQVLFEGQQQGAASVPEAVQMLLRVQLASSRGQALTAHHLCTGCRSQHPPQLASNTMLPFPGPMTLLSWPHSPSAMCPA